MDSDGSAAVRVGVTWGARLFIGGLWLMPLAVLTSLPVVIVVGIFDSALPGGTVAGLAVTAVLMAVLVGSAWWVWWRLLTRSCRAGADGLLVRGLWRTRQISWGDVVRVIAAETWTSARYVRLGRAKVSFTDGQKPKTVTVAVAWRDGPRAAYFLRLSAPLGHIVRNDLPDALRDASISDALLAPVDPQSVRSGDTLLIIRPSASVLVAQVVGLTIAIAALAGLLILVLSDLSVVTLIIGVLCVAGLVPTGVGLIGVFRQRVVVTSEGIMSRNLTRTVWLPWVWIASLDAVDSGVTSSVVAARLTDGRTVLLQPTVTWGWKKAYRCRDQLAELTAANSGRARRPVGAHA